MMVLSEKGHIEMTLFGTQFGVTRVAPSLRGARASSHVEVLLEELLTAIRPEILEKVLCGHRSTLTGTGQFTYLLQFDALGRPHIVQDTRWRISAEQFAITTRDDCVSCIRPTTGEDSELTPTLDMIIKQAYKFVLRTCFISSDIQVFEEKSRTFLLQGLCFLARHSQTSSLITYLT